jgi:hypothetical protein
MTGAGPAWSIGLVPGDIRWIVGPMVRRPGQISRLGRFAASVHLVAGHDHAIRTELGRTALI